MSKATLSSPKLAQRDESARWILTSLEVSGLKTPSLLFGAIAGATGDLHDDANALRSSSEQMRGDIAKLRAEIDVTAARLAELTAR